MERDWFYGGSTDALARGEWLRRREVTWVIWWPPECLPYGRPISPADVPGLTAVYVSPEALLYRFAPAPDRFAATPPGRTERR